MKLHLKLSILLLLQYPIVVAVLMWLYQGGSLFHPDATHYIYDQNYLSDLGRTQSFSAHPNPIWFVYSITLSLVGMGTGFFFYALQQILDSRFKILVTVLGIFSGLGYIGIAFSAVDVQLHQHLFWGRVAYFSFFFGLLLFNILLQRSRYPLIYKYVSILNVFLFAFLLLSLFGPSSKEGVSALQLKTLAQKLMVVLQIIISILIIRRIGIIISSRE